MCILLVYSLEIPIKLPTVVGSGGNGNIEVTVAPTQEPPVMPPEGKNSRLNVLLCKLHLPHING